MNANLRHSQLTGSRRLLAILIAGTMALCSRSVAAQGTDTIIRVDGPSVRGTVTATFKQGLKVDTSGGEKNIPTNEIKRVMFAGEPLALRQAKEALANGDTEQANRALQRVEQSDINRDLVEGELAFARALARAQLALQTGEGHAAAAKAMLDFLKVRPNSFHFYEGAETLGNLAVALGRLDSAAKYFAQLEKSPWPELQFRGAFLLAEALRAQAPDQLQDVLARYDAILESPIDSPAANRQKQLARLGRAAVQIELGDADASRNEIERIIEASDPADVELMGRAYNALGAYHCSKQQYTDAVLAYLHVDLLFASNQVAHAEALYNLGRLWAEVGKPDRGVDAANRLKANYGGSLWAKK